MAVSQLNLISSCREGFILIPPIKFTRLACTAQELLGDNARRRKELLYYLGTDLRFTDSKWNLEFNKALSKVSLSNT